MRHIWIIGGTTEGRLLAEFCEENRIYATVSVVSGYGENLLPEGKYITCKTRAMDEKGMEQFLLEDDITLVVDAAHPFARDVHQNIREACRKRNIRCIRCLREEADAREKETEHQAEIYRVKSVREAAEYLAGQKGNILVTTGSHSLREFQVIP
ncbi:MAG: precorrin-6A/cobalt-precorrin-6A reductase, partial [Clostridium sp.]|nr:precorrin-6A/cobalt-precorrin-6A reductase [Clostridium sp.]